MLEEFLSLGRRLSLPFCRDFHSISVILPSFWTRTSLDFGLASWRSFPWLFIFRLLAVFADILEFSYYSSNTRSRWDSAPRVLDWRQRQYCGTVMRWVGLLGWCPRAALATCISVEYYGFLSGERAKISAPFQVQTFASLLLRVWVSVGYRTLRSSLDTWRGFSPRCSLGNEIRRPNHCVPCRILLLIFRIGNVWW